MPTRNNKLPVVVIDDDLDALFFATKRIAKAGVQNPVITFSDAEAALAHLSGVQTTPGGEVASMIFCDMKMPGLNGVGFVRNFRKKVGGKQRIWMLSSSNEQPDRDAAVAAGADGYLVKYPSPEEFARIIGEAGA